MGATGGKTSRHPTADRALTEDEKRQAAEAERKKFLAAIAGAKLRAGELPRDLIKIVSFAVVNQVLIDVLNGTVAIRTATEAANIVKVALDVGRTEMGEADKNAAVPVTSEDRKAKIESAKLLLDEIKARHATLEDEEAAGGEAVAAVLASPIVDQSADAQAS